MLCMIRWAQALPCHWMMEKTMSAELDYGTIITDLDEVGFHIIPSVILLENGDEDRAVLEQLLE